MKALSYHSLSLFISDKIDTTKTVPPPLQALAAFEQQIILHSQYTFEDLATMGDCDLQSFSDLNNQLNNPEAIQRIAATKPDIIVSIRFGLIIGEQVIAIPQHGVINLHSGVLPDYRGVMATFRAMTNGDAEIGSTLHFIQDSSIDTGDIISIEKITNQQNSSYLLNTLNLYRKGCHQLITAVENLDRNIYIPRQAQKNEGHYFSFPTAEDLKHFTALGYQLFDPTELDAISTLLAEEAY
jgi:methionyl-tRNA formyltransferase